MRAEEQALMESVGRKSGRLELEWAVNRAEIVEMSHPRTSRINKRQDGDRRTKEDEAREQKKVMKMMKMRML